MLEAWENRGFCAFDYMKQKVSESIIPKKIYGCECLAIDIKDKELIEGVYIYPLKTEIQIGFYKKNHLQ